MEENYISKVLYLLLGERYMRKILCLIVISLFCLSSILPVVNSIYVEKSMDNGLMDSAWPMFQHDNKHTGRSPYGVLGNTGVVNWKFNMSGLTVSSPAIDNNGTIYFGGNTIGEDTFFAITPDGSLKWSVDIDWVFPSPAIATDGTIYVGSLKQFLYAFSSNGEERWRFKVGGGIFSSPAISDEGTIYFGSTDKNIYALNPDGSEKWHYTTEDSVYSSAAIDDKGYVYMGSHDGYLYALYSNGTLNWKYHTGGEIKSSPTIGDDGTIYVGSWDCYLYALHPNGTLKWKFKAIGGIDSPPAIDKDGNIYFGTYSRYFYSISPDGVENWRFKTGDDILSSPIIDKFGVIYICSTDGNLYVFNPDGSIRWIFATGATTIHSTPAISKDGTIYICPVFATTTSFTHSIIYSINTTVVHKPSNPTINGEQYGYINREYTYSASSFHIDGINVSYFFDWGDGSNSGWTDFEQPRTLVNASHSWKFQGNYLVRVKAKDIYGAESDWSTFPVGMPKTYINNPIIQQIIVLLGRFPLFEKILNQIF
jgi:outer membrane protein assembly factor BamB